MKRLFVLVLVSVLALLSGAVMAQTPTVATANPNASPTARAILNYLYTLDDRQDSRLISGQFGMYGDGETYQLAWESLLRVEQKTGQLPGITGADYASEIGIQEVNRYLIDRWNEGYLLTLSWHSPDPCTGGGANSTSGSSYDLTRVLPGGSCHAAWLRSLDQIAVGLQQLEDAGVVVMWRPFHENNGPWFWWGANRNPENFRALWRHMFDYYTTTKGLSNLLWAFSPNHKWDQWAAGVLTYYPGAQYVDIVGVDKYMGCTATDSDRRVTSYESTLDIAASYADLVSTGKPIGLLELGIIPASGACYAVNPYPYEWTHLIRDIKARYPRIVMFQAWEWVFQLGRDNFRGLPEMMDDPWVVARHELPNFRSGSPQIPTVNPSLPTATLPATVPGATVVPVSPTPTNTPPVSSGQRVLNVSVVPNAAFVQASMRIVETRPASGNRVYLQAEISGITGIRRVMFYIGERWIGDDSTAPYTLGAATQGYTLPTVPQEIRVLVVYNTRDEFVEGRFTYTPTTGGQVTPTAVTPTQTIVPPTATPTATTTPTVTPTVPPRTWEVRLCFSINGVEFCTKLKS